MTPDEARDNAKADAVMLQVELGMTLDVSETLAARGIDTAERVKHRKPELWKATKAMLGHGISPKKIEELLSMDIRTVLAIQAEGEKDGSIPPYKQRTVRQLEAIITLGLDSLLEKARDGKISAIELCALADKRELLSGGITNRTMIVEDPAAAEFRRFLQSNPVHGMVSATGELAQKAPPAGAAAAIGNGAPEPVDGKLLERTDDLTSPDEDA